MAFSIESRVPFISKDIVEFCLSLPVSLRINKGYTKAVLHEAIKGIVPEDVRLRVDKLGFPAPEVDWLKNIPNKYIIPRQSRMERNYYFKMKTICLECDIN